MPTILLVEDHEEVWDVLSRRLKRHGFTVAIALDGREAVEAVRDQPPDVVLLDMNLPAIDGWEVARRLRSDPRCRAVPIIALTAYAGAEDRAKALHAGCNDYHPKPVDFSRLLLQIEAALDRTAERTATGEPSRETRE